MLCIERIDKILPSSVQKIERYRYFFMTGCLPEIIHKWYSRSLVADLTGVVPLPSIAINAQSTADDNNDDNDDPGRL